MIFQLARIWFRSFYRDIDVENIHFYVKEALLHETEKAVLDCSPLQLTYLKSYLLLSHRLTNAWNDVYTCGPSMAWPYGDSDNLSNPVVNANEGGSVMVLT